MTLFYQSNLPTTGNMSAFFVGLSLYLFVFLLELSRVGQGERSSFHIFYFMVLRHCGGKSEL
jgi:hypothetical protein